MSLMAVSRPGSSAPMTDKTTRPERTEENTLEPELPICDPHHHLWEYPDSTYLVDEFLADISSGHRVDKTVYVECKQKYRTSGPDQLQPVGEIEFVDKITRSYQRNPAIAAAIVGYADLRLGNAVREVLEAQLQASRRFRGIRHASAWHQSDSIRNAHTQPTRDMLQDKDFLTGFAHLQALGLRFDAWLYFEQIPQLTELARKFPGTPIVLNHVGGPIGIGPYAGRREEVFAVWRENIFELSGCENVSVKLGGMTMSMSGFNWHKQTCPPDSETIARALAPYFYACIDYFGPERCMFESNFPMDRISCSYHTLWNVYKRVSHAYSQDERVQLLHDTACRFYGI